MEINIKKQLVNRLHRIKGQVEGLERMVEKEKYCPEIIAQSLSIQESLKGFNATMLENHIREHVGHQIQHGKMEKAVEELVRIYKLKSK